MSKFGLWRESLLSPAVNNPAKSTAVDNPAKSPAVDNPEEVKAAKGVLARLIKLISPVKSIPGNANNMVDILININKEILNRNNTTVGGILPRIQAMKVFNALMGNNSPTNENKS